MDRPRITYAFTLAMVFTVLFAAGLVVVTVFAFVVGRLQGTGGWLMLAAMVPVLLLLALAFPLLALASLALRDFVAPLQPVTGLPCGAAARLLESLVVAQPGVFVLYLLLKLLVMVGTGLVVVIGGCLTCCLGFLPIVMQAAFQPLFHFERGLSLMLLRQMGYDVARAPRGLRSRAIGQGILRRHHVADRDLSAPAGDPTFAPAPPTGARLSRVEP